MIRILHGDDEVKIHSALSVILSDATSRHVQIERVDAKRTNFPELESLLGTDQLFATERIVVIDGLLGLPKSKAKDELLDLVAGSTTEIVCVEKKIATIPQLKKFPKARDRKSVV